MRNKNELSDDEFCLSLSRTSWLSFGNVKWLFDQCDGNRQITSQLFNYWSKLGFISIDLIKLIKENYYEHR